MEADSSQYDEIFVRSQTPYISFIILKFVLLMLMFYIVSVVFNFQNATFTTAFYVSLFISIIVALLFIVFHYLQGSNGLRMLFLSLLILIGIGGASYMIVTYYGVGNYAQALLYFILVWVLAAVVSYFMIFMIVVGHFGLLSAEKRISEIKSPYKE